MSEMCCTREIQDAKMMQKSPSAHHRTTLSGYIFATKARIDNRKKVVKQLYSAGRPSRWALAHISSLGLMCAISKSPTTAKLLNAMNARSKSTVNSSQRR